MRGLDRRPTRPGAPVPLRGDGLRNGRFAGGLGMNASTPPPIRDFARNADLVLIVDDVPDNLAVLHDALDESGYTVLVATSGDAALQRAAQARPDIVLLDAMMPGMDGFEVARRLKADPATAHI